MVHKSNATAVIDKRTKINSEIEMGKKKIRRGTGEKQQRVNI